MTKPKRPPSAWPSRSLTINCGMIRMIPSMKLATKRTPNPAASPRCTIASCCIMFTPALALTIDRSLGVVRNWHDCDPPIETCQVVKTRLFEAAHRGFLPQDRLQPEFGERGRID